jgi:hypothetical protein
MTPGNPGMESMEHPQPPRSTWRVWSWRTLAVVVVIPLLVGGGIAVWLFVPRASTQPLAMALYVGESAGVPIVVEWPPYHLLVAEPPQIPSGWTAETLPESLQGATAFFEAEAADWSVVTTDRGRRLQITNRRSERLALQRRAVFRQTKTVRGATLGERGRTLTSTVVVPRWEPANAWEAGAIDSQRRFIGSEPWLTPWYDLEDVWMSWREGGWGPNQWEAEDRLSVVCLTPELLSVLQHHWEYTGGAHGNYGTSALTWYRVSGTGAVQEVRLPELFRSASPWKARLLEVLADAYVEARRGRFDDESPPEAAALTEGHLDYAWAVTPAGLRFYYPPYELGSYAEGEYVLLVPWAKIADLLAKEGPAAALPITMRRPSL